ncbi:MAG: MBL fold metallo-hydrolase [Clostridia bacterium]|nr:MBL fold metallo-hydrolase [Clostridia bacterium]
MKVLIFSPSDYFGANTYVIISHGEAVVIDPSVSASVLYENPDLSGITVKHIVLTHAHFDHMLEVDSWVKETGATLYVGVADARALSDEILNCYALFFGIKKGYYGPYKTLAEGDTITCGRLLLRVIDVPGHTRGSIALYTDGVTFVGDTVFEGGALGRVDLPGGSYTDLQNSLKKIMSLPESTTVYSGHGGATNIEELKSNFK